jgi:hypothetical protein
MQKLLHIIQFRFQDFAIGLHNGGNHHNQADFKIALLGRCKSFVIIVTVTHTIEYGAKHKPKDATYRTTQSPSKASANPLTERVKRHLNQVKSLK